MAPVCWGTAAPARGVSSSPPRPRVQGCAPSLAPRNTLGCSSRRAGPGGVRGGCPPALGAPGQQLGLSPAAPLARERGSGLMLLRGGVGTGGGAGAAGRGPHCTRGGGRGDRDPALAAGTVPTLNPLARTGGTVSCLSAPPLPSSAARLSSTLLCRGCSCGVSAPVVPRQSPPPSGSGFAAVPAGRCCPSKPCSNGPQSWPRQIRHPPRAGRGGHKLLTGWHRPPWPRTGKELCPGAGAVPLVVPASPWDPLPMSRIQHPLRVLRWVLLPAAAWDPASPGLCPCSGWGSAWPGGTPWGCHRPLRPGGAARVGGSHGLRCGSLAPVSPGAGAWVGRAPQVLPPMEWSGAGLAGT